MRCISKLSKRHRPWPSNRASFPRSARVPGCTRTDGRGVAHSRVTTHRIRARQPGGPSAHGRFGAMTMGQSDQIDWRTQ